MVRGEHDAEGHAPGPRAGQEEQHAATHHRVDQRDADLGARNGSGKAGLRSSFQRPRSDGGRSPSLEPGDRGTGETASMTYPVRVGLKYAPMATTPERMREVWTAADQAGFDHLWIMDHFMPLVRSATGWYQFAPTDSVFEAWNTLAAMAEVAKRIRIGINVTGNLYRYPAVLAKTAARSEENTS